MRVSTCLLGAAISIAVTGVANSSDNYPYGQKVWPDVYAADIPGPIRPAAAYSSSPQSVLFSPVSIAYSNWTGIYIGGHGGYGWGTGTLSVGPFDISSDINGVFGGGQIGWGFQFTPWVVGIEIDSSGGNIGRSESATTGGITATASSRIGYMGSARARFGYAFDRVLLYGTAGVGWANNRVSVGVGPVSLSDSATHFGFAGGGGVEFALDKNWTIGAEYLFMSLPSVNYFAGLLPAPLDGGIGIKGDVQTVRGKLNYYFR